MTTQNPTSAPVHSELGRAARPICGGPHCTSCPPTVVHPIPVKIDASMLTNGSLFVTSIKPGVIKAPEPELTVKQAAKAYKKAVRAYDAAVQAQKDADDAAVLAARARNEAAEARNVAHAALEKAAKR
jgi:hypothetical protein